MKSITCALCHNPIDPRQAHFILGFGKIHPECQQRDGRTPDEIAATTVCCRGMELFQGLGGHVVEAYEHIPPDEVWVSLPQENRIKRFRIRDDYGRFVIIPLPPQINLQVGKVVLPDVGSGGIPENMPQSECESGPGYVGLCDAGSGEESGVPMLSSTPPDAGGADVPSWDEFGEQGSSITGEPNSGA